MWGAPNKRSDSIMSFFRGGLRKSLGKSASNSKINSKRKKYVQATAIVGKQLFVIVTVINKASVSRCSDAHRNFSLLGKPKDLSAQMPGKELRAEQTLPIGYHYIEGRR